jgi:hypothetical protein
MVDPNDSLAALFSDSQALQTLKDDGFTERVLAQLPTRRRTSLLWTTAAVGSVAVIAALAGPDLVESFLRDTEVLTQSLLGSPGWGVALWGGAIGLVALAVPRVFEEL